MVFRYFAMVVLGGWASVAWPHGGAVDQQGGHREKATGQYHCHRETCFSGQGQSLAPQAQVGTDSARFSTLYNRKEWPHWIDLDGDCQDARAEMLIQTSQVPVKYKRNQSCNVSHGRWIDPYTGKTFTRAADLDIDHVVPLAWAHGHGGANWSRADKRRFANDVANLIPVQASINREKGSQGPDDWLPPNRVYQCQYLSQFLGVVRRYGLRMEMVEVRRLGPLANRCRVRL